MAEVGDRYFEAIIVGGGVVGAVVALGLADAGRQVALLEKQRPRPHPGVLGVDLRTVALSPASRDLLQQLRIWRGLRPAPFNAMRVWEERGTARLCFDAADVGRAELGWIQESGPLAEVVWARLEQHSNVALILSEPLAGVEPAAEAVTLTTGGRRLRTPLLVAADGARSPVRERLGVKTQVRDTGQVALASIVRTAGSHGQTAWQRFLLDGPLALLPCADAQTAALVWSQSPNNAARRKELDAAAFCAELTHLSEGCAGEITAVDQRLCLSLNQCLATAFNPHPRVLLVGDAARVVHPLAGFGLNLGLEDAVGLLRRAEGVLDLGAPGLWRMFALRRRARSLGMVRLLAALQGFYALPQPPMQLLRNFGVRLINESDAVKRQLISEALGFGPLARNLR